MTLKYSGDIEEKPIYSGDGGGFMLEKTWEK